MKYKYLITYGGGLGPNVWDAEMVVEAYNIHEALTNADKELQEDDYRSDYEIYSIERED